MRPGSLRENFIDVIIRRPIEVQMAKPNLGAAACAIVLTIAAIRAAGAAPQQFDCVLTDTANQLASENRPIAVSFDDAAKTLSAQAGGQNFSFDNVSISTIAISGNNSTSSVGIDRSSLGIVWQQYGAASATEFGQCQPGNAAAPAAPH